ncbi:MAG: hypothetical protein JWN50_517 [Parcubacteria group bacterium]|nr:hypothetical protein [Parcubacteria group bacterium]
MKKSLFVLAIALLILAGGAYYFVQKQATDPTGWKTYDNKEFGFSFQYPPNFTLEENRSSDGGSFTVGVGDPVTRAGYVSVEVFTQQKSKEEVADFFTGPYPKEIAPFGNTSSTTVALRTLDGLKGVERYGYAGEGSSYDDIFMYESTYLWMVVLDPVAEGRLTEEREPGAPVPDRAIYERILSSLHFSS